KQHPSPGGKLRGGQLPADGTHAVFVTMAPDGKTRVNLWNLATKTAEWESPNGSRVYFSEDGRYVASHIFGGNQEVRVVRIADGHEMCVTEPGHSFVWDICF